MMMRSTLNIYNLILALLITLYPIIIVGCGKRMIPDEKYFVCHPSDNRIDTFLQTSKNFADANYLRLIDNGENTKQELTVIYEARKKRSDEPFVESTPSGKPVFIGLKSEKKEYFMIASNINSMLKDIINIEIYYTSTHAEKEAEKYLNALNKSGVELLENASDC